MRRREHVERARGRRVVRQQRVINRARDRADGRLMQHVIHVGTRGVTRGVTRHPIRDRSLVQVDTVREVCQVLALAGREVVDDSDPHTCIEKSLNEVRSDKTGSAGHQKGLVGKLRHGFGCRWRLGRIAPRNLAILICDTAPRHR